MHTNTINEVVARNVHQAMSAAGENPSSIAAATGIHRTTITRRLTGTSDWTTTDLERIAAHFDTTPAQLIVAA